MQHRLRFLLLVQDLLTHSLDYIASINRLALETPTLDLLNLILPTTVY